MMRILAMSPTFLPAVGGAELLLLHVLRRLAQRHEVRLVTPQLPCRVVKRIGHSEYDGLVNFDVVRFDDAWSLMRLRGHRIMRGAIAPFSLSAVTAMHRAVRDFGPDVVNVHYCMPTGLAAVWAQRALDVPTVLSLTGRDVPGPGVPPLWRWWHRMVGRRVAQTTVITDWCRRAVWGTNSPPLPILPGGVDMPCVEDPARTKAIRRQWGVPAGGALLFALQRFDAVKRVDVLVRAMAHVRRAVPGAVLVIGGKGAERGACEALARELGLEDAVRFAGFVPDAEVAALMQASEAFVFHSTYETFGIVAAQAMACARPVVAAADPAVAEVVEHGRTGLLTPVLDHEAMGRAVVEILTQPDLRRTMGQAGRRKAKACYTWDAVAAGYEAVFHDVTGA